MCGQAAGAICTATRIGWNYLYYLLRSFEQKGRVEYEDMPRLFLERAGIKRAYLTQLNPESGAATMNLEWKTVFWRAGDTVMKCRFRELAVMLEEFASQMGQAADITEEKRRTQCGGSSAFIDCGRQYAASGA